VQDLRLQELSHQHFLLLIKIQLEYILMVMQLPQFRFLQIQILKLVVMISQLLGGKKRLPYKIFILDYSNLEKEQLIVMALQ
jgi:hypothetical protein